VSYHYSYLVTAPARERIDDLSAREEVAEHLQYATEYGRELLDGGHPEEALEPLGVSCTLWERLQTHYANELPEGYTRSYWRALVEIAHARAQLGQPALARKRREQARSLRVKSLEPVDTLRMAALEQLLRRCEQQGAASPLPQGPRVTHATFGLGTVLEESDGRCRVQFDDGEERVILSERLIRQS
jgi:hypothetical protein